MAATAVKSMKKLFLSVSLFIFGACAVFAASTEVNSLQEDTEKIYLFDVTVKVQQDGELEVTENITLNVLNKEIKRGITRDLPDTRKEKATPVSLTMDGQPHPFFTEPEGRYLGVNFGDDNLISKGVHTYSFTYKYSGAIRFLKNYDELYWNVTGNDWSFVIDKARIKIILPEGARVQEEGISLYTGKRGSKEHNAVKTGDLTFETLKPILQGEGFTVSVPFDKDIVPPPSLKPYLMSKPFKAAAVLFVIYLLFCLITWVKDGRDPFYAGVVQYEPPKDVSPAFMYHLNGGQGDSKVLSCIIISLAMKGYIKVEEDGYSKIIFKRLKTNYDNLPEEEKIFMERIFWYSEGSPLDESRGAEMASAYNTIIKKFNKDKNNFLLQADGYKALSFLFLCALTFVPAYLNNPNDFFIAFVNIGVLIWSFITLKILHACFVQGNLPLLVRVLILPFLVAIPCFVLIPLLSDGLDSWLLLLCEIPFVLAVVVHYIYVTLIENVTPRGAEYFEHLKGFKRYMTTAETHRVELSNPADAQRIFCDYLPYAFALGLHNKWMKKFEVILSKEIVQRCVASTCASEYVISRGLSSCIADSIASSNSGGGSSGGSSGSFGGGSSGGGSGGGGGHGR